MAALEATGWRSPPHYKNTGSLFFYSRGEGEMLAAALGSSFTSRALETDQAYARVLWSAGG